LALIPPAKYGLDQSDDHIKYPYCLTRPWSKEELILRKMKARRELCPTEIYLMHHFQHYMNFTLYMANNEDLYSSQRRSRYGLSVGTIWTAIHITDTSVKPISSAFIGQHQCYIMYCEHFAYSNGIIKTSALYTTFDLPIWISLLSAILICSLVSCITISAMSKPSSSNIPLRKHIKLLSSNLFEYYRILVEKEDNYINNSSLIFAFAIIVIANEYRNFVTANLISPTKPHIIQNATELLDNGFVLWLPTTQHTKYELQQQQNTFIQDFLYNIDPRRRAHYRENIQKWFQLILKPRYEIIVNLTDTRENIALYINAGDIDASFDLYSAEFANYPKSCHFIKQPLSVRLKTMYFFNQRAEEFVDWTSKFLAYGLIQQWKLMQDIQLSGLVRLARKLEYSVANITEQSQLNDELIRNEHLWGVYCIIGICNLAGFLALLAELLIPQGDEVFMMNLTTYVYLFYWKICHRCFAPYVRSLCNRKR
jgi:hypothetical protein